jgi:hypothetical protein
MASVTARQCHMELHYDACATSGAVSLLDMLKRFAFSFYEVVTRIEQLRVEAQTLTATLPNCMTVRAINLLQHLR